MAPNETFRALLVASLALSAAAACDGGSSANSEPAGYLRSDSPELETAWPSTLPIYHALHQDEEAVVRALGLDATTRALVGENVNRLSFTTATGNVQVFYDEGAAEPFHTLKYLRTEPFQAQTWSGSAELRSKWEAGARVAAEYLQKLTQLTPVVIVGRASDADYAKALTEGYQFMLAVDHRLVWVEDLEVRVDEQGIYEFTTDELVFDATRSGSADCLTQAEVEGLLAGSEYKTPDPSLAPPIYYGFATDVSELAPFYLAVGAESGPLAIWLRRP
jgi:hypothetical protein